LRRPPGSPKARRKVARGYNTTLGHRHTERAVGHSTPLAPRWHNGRQTLLRRGPASSTPASMQRRGQSTGRSPAGFPSPTRSPQLSRCHRRGDRCRRPRCCRPTGRHLRRPPERRDSPVPEGSGGPCEGTCRQCSRQLCRDGDRSRSSRDRSWCSGLPRLGRTCTARPREMARPPRQARRVSTDRRESGCRFRVRGRSAHAWPGTATVRDRISVIRSASGSSGQAAESQRTARVLAAAVPNS